MVPSYGRNSSRGGGGGGIHAQLPPGQNLTDGVNRLRPKGSLLGDPTPNSHLLEEDDDVPEDPAAVPASVAGAPGEPLAEGRGCRGDGGGGREGRLGCGHASNHGRACQPTPTYRNRVRGVPHRVLHRVRGVLHKVGGVLHRVLGVD